jgi:hypothetical protein
VCPACEEEEHSCDLYALLVGRVLCLVWYGGMLRRRLVIAGLEDIENNAGGNNVSVCCVGGRIYPQRGFKQKMMLVEGISRRRINRRQEKTCAGAGGVMQSATVHWRPERRASPPQPHLPRWTVLLGLLR